MKTKSFTLSILAAIAIAAALIPSSPRVEHAVLASGSAVVLMNAQTAAGIGQATLASAVTPAENGADAFTFALVTNGNAGRVQIEQSLDGGTTWIPAHQFPSGSTLEIWRAPSCGVCSFRVNKLDLSTATATVSATMSGTGVAFAPTFTPTKTPTPTLTPTTTPTHS